MVCTIRSICSNEAHQCRSINGQLAEFARMVSTICYRSAILLLSFNYPYAFLPLSFCYLFAILLLSLCFPAATFCYLFAILYFSIQLTEYFLPGLLKFNFEKKLEVRISLHVTVLELVVRFFHIL